MAIDRNIILKARLILYNRGSILLLKQTNPHGGQYTFVGGNIEQSEFAKASLVREAQEEAGIVIKQEDLRLAHVLHKRDKAGQRIILYFKTAVWQGEPRTKEPHKFKEAAWFPLDALPKGLSGTARHVLKMYRKGEMYSEYLKK